MAQSGVLTFYNDSGGIRAQLWDDPVFRDRYKNKIQNEWQCTLKFKAYDPTFYDP